MFKNAAPRSVAGCRLPVSFCLLSFAVAVALNCGSSAAGQTIKAALVSTTLETTSFAQWSQDLAYQETQLYPLSFGGTGCPFVDVEVAGVKVALMLDTGTARGLVITNNAPAIPHRVEERNEELNADGSHRGESFIIRVEAVSVLGQVFKNVAGTLSDWKMFSSEPFNGTVGLDFFLDRRLTLDYRSRKVGVTASPLPEKLDRKRYLSVDLVEPPKSQGHILYARARVNGREAIVYFDTGYNVSFIDPDFAQGLARVERPGKFKVFREGVPLELGGHTFAFDELRESPVRRGTGFDLPVALVLGSDVLSRFIVTIDLPAKKLILALAV
jgi:predicted aspartyl protease